MEVFFVRNSFVVEVEVNRNPNVMVLSLWYLQRCCQEAWKVTDVGGSPHKREASCVIGVALYYEAE
jgi:hypothetical protein